jgi:hypothetical protein
MSGRQQVILMGRRRSDGELIPLDCNNEGELYSADTPELVDFDGTDVVPVGIVNTVTATFDGVAQPVNVQNLPADPPSATNQTTANGHLSAIKTAVESLDAKTPTLSDGRVPTVDLMVTTTPLIGNGTCPASPANLQLASLNAGDSATGWYLTNESGSVNIRVGGNTASGTIGWQLGFGQSTHIASLALANHYVSGIGGTAAISIRGAS